MRRREFITLLGGAAAAWPLAVRAQQSAAPVMGFLYSLSPEPIADRLRQFRQGLKDNGFVEGENVTILFRWAENHVDRLATLAADLVSRQVAVIAARNSLSALALKAGRPRRSRSCFPSMKTRSGSVLSRASRGQRQCDGHQFFHDRTCGTTSKCRPHCSPAPTRLSSDEKARVHHPARRRSLLLYAPRRGPVWGHAIRARVVSYYRNHQPARAHMRDQQ